MGNSYQFGNSSTKATVHPHVHGELGDYNDGVLQVYGSSPRAWGTHLPVDHHLAVLRFIPTCMGNSGGSFKTQSTLQVHPHVHGELFTVSFD